MNTENQLFFLKDIPPIGFGPGIAGYSSKMKKQHHGVANLFYRVINKVLYYWVRKNYINAVANALNLGFRLIDYSSAYGDGSLLQQAIQKSGVPREKLFITTRVSNYAQREGRVREEFLKFLQNMKLDYVDLLQFHWPVTGLYLDTWREMEKLYEEGYAKHLGVANCHQHHLEEILKICKYRPEVGQFEIHPLFTQKTLIQYYKDNGIVCFDPKLIQWAIDDALYLVALVESLLSLEEPDGVLDRAKELQGRE